MPGTILSLNCYTELDLESLMKVRRTSALKPQIKVLAVFLLVCGLAAWTPTVDAQAYKPGPVFYTSTGQTLTFQYDASIADKEIQTGNTILNQYVPELFRVFWEPKANRVVKVHQDSTSCDGGSACAGGTDVWIGYYPWSLEWASTWVHELAHTLQFSGPVLALSRQDLELFYTESTAGAIEFILAPENSSTSTEDHAFWIPDWGVAEAVYGYSWQAQGDRPHLYANIWIGLYRADHNVFRNVNAQMDHLAEEGLSIADVASFRELIQESTSATVLDGLPIKQWLAVGGMLARSEVGNAPITHFNVLRYDQWGPGSELYISFEAVAIDRTIQLNASQTTATIYDTITRTRIAQVTSEYTCCGEQRTLLYVKANLDQSPAAVRVDLHIVGDNFIDNRSILLPLFSYPPGNFILIATHDQWIDPVNATAHVAGMEQEVLNGILAFDSNASMVDIALAGAPDSHVENFLPRSYKVMVIGLDHAALELMTDSMMVTYFEWVKVPSAVWITTNCTVYSFQFDSIRRLLNFTLGGSSGTIGYVSVTFRTDLIDGTPIVLIDNGSTPPMTLWITSNSSHHTISFTYPHSDHRIVIGGSNTIPEFGNMVLQFILPLLIVVCAIVMRRLPRRLRTPDQLLQPKASVPCVIAITKRRVTSRYIA